MKRSAIKPLLDIADHALFRFVGLNVRKLDEQALQAFLDVQQCIQEYGLDFVRSASHDVRHGYLKPADLDRIDAAKGDQNLAALIQTLVEEKWTASKIAQGRHSFLEESRQEFAPATPALAPPLW